MKKRKDLNRTGKNRRNRTIAAAVFFTLCAAALTVCIFIRAKTGQAKELGLSNIQSVTAAKGSISNTIDASGNLEAAKMTDITVPVGIKVENIKVESGDEVAKGQVLATLNKTSVARLLIDVRDSLDTVGDELDKSSLSSLEKEELEGEKEELTAMEETLAALYKKPSIKAPSAGIIGTISIAENMETTKSSSSAGSSADSTAQSSSSLSQMSAKDTGNETSPLLFLTSGSANGSSAETKNTRKTVSDYSGPSISESCSVSSSSGIPCLSSDTGSFPSGISCLSSDTSPASGDGSGSATGADDGSASGSGNDDGSASNTDADNGSASGSDGNGTNSGSSSGSGAGNGSNNNNSSGDGSGSGSTGSNNTGDGSGAGNGDSSGSGTGNNSNSGNCTPPSGSSSAGSGNSASDAGNKADGNAGNSGDAADSGGSSGKPGAFSAGSPGSSMAGSSPDSASANSSTASDASSTYTSAYETVAFTLTSQDTVKITVNVDELDILSVEKDQEASVTLDALGNEAFTGTVTKISNTASAGSGSTKYEVEITVPMDERMRIGMTASAAIQVSKAEDALILPMTALQQKGEDTFVYTKKDKDGNLSGEVTVTTGLSDGQNAEITEGLDEGTEVYYTRSSGNAESLEKGNGFPGIMNGGGMPDTPPDGGRQRPDSDSPRGDAGGNTSPGGRPSGN